MASQHNTQAMIKAYSGGEWYRHWSACADKLNASEEALVRAWCTDPNAAILNIGCGAGRESIAMYRMGYGNVQGLDCAQALIEVARKQVAEYQMQIAFHVAAASQMPFPDNSFHAITYFSNTHGHITPRFERVATLAEIKRVLKPGGLLLMNVNSIHLWITFRMYFAVTGLLHLVWNPCQLEKGDKRLRTGQSPAGMPKKDLPRTHWFRPGEIEGEAADAGLAVALSTASDTAIRSSRINDARRFHRGWLVYVLEKR